MFKKIPFREGSVLSNLCCKNIAFYFFQFHYNNTKNNRNLCLSASLKLLSINGEYFCSINDPSSCHFRQEFAAKVEKFVLWYNFSGRGKEMRLASSKEKLEELEREEAVLLQGIVHNSADRA